MTSDSGKEEFQLICMLILYAFAFMPFENSTKLAVQCSSFLKKIVTTLTAIR